MIPPGLFLVDTSAIARVSSPAVVRELVRLGRLGLLATCATVDLEVLYSARSPAEYRSIASRRHVGFTDLPLLPEIGDRARAVQSQLSKHSQHRAAGVIDLITDHNHGPTAFASGRGPQVPTTLPSFAVGHGMSRITESVPRILARTTGPTFPRARRTRAGETARMCWHCADGRPSSQLNVNDITRGQHRARLSRHLSADNRAATRSGPAARTEPRASPCFRRMSPATRRAASVPHGCRRRSEHSHFAFKSAYVEDRFRELRSARSSRYGLVRTAQVPITPPSSLVITNVAARGRPCPSGLKSGQLLIA